MLTQLIQPGPDFRHLFEVFEHTAFRLEVRDRYDAPYENESLRKFLEGEQDNLPWMQSWQVMLRDLNAQGRRFARVRVVSLPLTDYSRFGVWCAQFTNRAGEDIRYLTRDQAQADGLPARDYWLFDSRTQVQLHFDDEGRFLGGEVIEEPAVIVQHTTGVTLPGTRHCDGTTSPQNSTSVSKVHEARAVLADLAYRASRTRYTQQGCHHGERKPRRPCGQGAARRDGDPR